MKKIFKLLFSVAIVGAVLSSCSKDERQIFSGDSTTYFTKSTETINATDEVGTTTTLKVITTTLSSSERQYTLELDEASTVALGTDFTLSSASVVIPANEYEGTIQLTSVLTEATNAGGTAVFNLIGDDVAVFNNSITVNLNHKTCELLANTFSGDYTLTVIDGDNGLAPAFTPNTIVTLVEVDETTRSFDAVFLEGAGVGQPAMTFTFTLDCGLVVPADEQSTFLNCGEPILLSSADVKTSYSAFDDSEILITFYQDIAETCPADAVVTTIKLTKN